ncbi:MAG: anti-sigma F factor [Lachnospiraceae bacterium]|nr:anti-sigma F factor [Lachnospiraceae bacterium]
MNSEKNEMELSFDAVSENESFARVAVAAFVTHINPTLEEIDDVKTAVSEAVTNAIIHGYENYRGYVKGGEGERPVPVHQGKVYVRCRLEGDVLHIEVQDQGKGIADIARAMEPMYTSRPELDRSGMGFSFMEAFMDDLEVESRPAAGTIVRMTKKLGSTSWIACGE